jgi:hypothetical protein
MLLSTEFYLDLKSVSSSRKFSYIRKSHFFMFQTKPSNPTTKEIVGEPFCFVKIELSVSPRY